MIAGLFLLVLLPLAMAGVVYALRRWAALSALLAVGTASALGILVVVLPLDWSVQVWGYEIVVGDRVSLLGRELILEQADRMAIAFSYLAAAGIFVLAWRVTPRALLFPIGLSLLGLLSGALLVRPLIYAALLIEIAAALSVFALQVEGQRPTRGGMHYLAFTMLALPGLMVTHWLMDRYALTPDDSALLNASGILLTISFALLLGGVPFHTWLPAVTGDSEPLASAFVLTISNGVIWLLLLDFLQAYPDLVSYAGFGALVSAVGLAMVVVGGLLAPAQRRLGRLMGYGVLIDNGAALIALAMRSPVGVSLMLLLLLMRPFGIGLMAAGLKGLRTRGGGDDGVGALQGLGRVAPWSTIALVIGGLSTAGMPVSAGFVGRWALYRHLAPSDPGAVVLLLLASVGMTAGVWRGVSALLVRHQLAEEDEPRSNPIREHWLTAVVLALGAAICIGLGLFPQSVAPLADRVAESYTFFTP